VISITENRDFLKIINFIAKLVLNLEHKSVEKRVYTMSKILNIGIAEDHQVMIDSLMTFK